MAVPPRPVAGATLGTDWGQAVHDTIVSYDLQAGLVNMSIGAAFSQVAVVFPRQFAAPPIVVVALASAPGSTNKLVARSTSQSPTGVTVMIYTADGSTLSASVLVHWMAYGPRV